MLDFPASASGIPDLRLSPQDRAGGPIHEDAMARRAGNAAGKQAGTRKATRGNGGNAAASKNRKAGTRGNGRAGRRGGRRRRSFLGRIVYGCVVLTLWAAIALTGLVVYHATQLPPIDRLAVPKRPPNIEILANDGTLIANRGETGGRNVSIHDLPGHVPQAFIAIEDRRFYSHFGIDPVGIGRALATNLATGATVQGGSTITQQLAKNLFLTHERTASRKIQEAILALWLERRHGKDELLELYMNRVYFGAGAYGVEAAARRYFDKAAEELTLAEAAMLAGLVQAPSRLAPTRNPQAARDRAALVLNAMANQGFIDENRMANAMARPAEINRPLGPGTANYAADYVMDVLDDFIGAVQQDVIVHTTIDLGLQQAAEASLIAELSEQGERFGVEQGAIVSLRPDGAIKALVGGKDYAQSQFNRAVAARRQPGSAFKPFVYLAAMERGLTPDTIREDRPIRLGDWSPENFSRDFRGPVTLREALSLSLNTVAVSLGMEVGVREVISVAQRLGIRSALQANASIALGTSEVTPLELTGAYATFANGGTGVIPHVITRVETASGEVLYHRVRAGLGQVIDDDTVSKMNAMMHETMVAGTGRRAALPDWQAGGKTGTSQGFRDAWFVGYTASLVTGVWIGNDDNSSTNRASGGNLPLDIWARYMERALAAEYPMPLPGADRWHAPRDPGGFAPPMVEHGPVPPGTTGGIAAHDGRHDGVPPAPVGIPPQQSEPGFLGRLFGVY
ncbi:MAG: PBP1A family penicillin-binding protein [Salinarimonas sp.]|nr:PBP1A family penicillin-binding protein [Salinarimonas sp.]